MMFSAHDGDDGVQVLALHAGTMGAPLFVIVDNINNSVTKSTICSFNAENKVDILDLILFLESLFSLKSCHT